MQSEPLTRAAILALTGPALDEAMVEHVAPWPLWDGSGIAPPRPFLMRGATGFMFLPEAGWLDWHPHRSLDAVHTLELALTETQQQAYAHELNLAIQERFSSEPGWPQYALLSRLLEPADCCHALLLAVVAPEE